MNRRERQIDLTEARVLLMADDNCHTATTGINNRNNEPFLRDFEPRPRVTAYPNDVRHKDEIIIKKDFEPRPSITTYSGDAKLKGETAFKMDFTPRPSITVYPDDAKLELSKTTFKKDSKSRL
ncbi:hypothetical protein M9H77_20300 [Catharanthus roseus]|uniref:Uncharacterized protein n=1 Tax=Catharanthus roseus TaxID=4058 RepID=A0ACC0ALU2_CATRO|nr:hypothetical protein M9H77_20300 [Catharanthus roseus]